MIKNASGQLVHFTGRVVGSTLLLAGIFSSVVLAQSDSSIKIKDLPVTVQPGDTFSSILARELNSLNAWGEVARYNNLASPDTLKPGQVIVIPAVVLHQRNYATVVHVKGTALHHDNVDNAKRDISKGDRIYSGDLIETDEDGFVSVSFNGGTSINIQPESTMKINVLECVNREEACDIDLESGKGELGLDVRSIGFEKPTEFNIKTPYASAAVRGTRFDFDVNDGNVLGVTEGVVEISFNGASNDIGIGKGVLAGEGKSINEVFDLLEPPEIELRDDINRISSEDIINWQPVDEADSYQIAFASSESMQDVSSSISETKTFTKPDLTPGEAYVTARAVASNGLRGFNSQKKLVAVDIDTDVESPVLDIIIDGDEMQITASGNANDEIEVKIGNSLETISNEEYIVANQVHQISGGETLSFEISRTVEWYIQGRKVKDPATVSRYGLLYFFEKTGG